MVEMVCCVVVPCDSNLVSGPFGVEDFALTGKLPYHIDGRCHPKYARLNSPYTYAFIGSYLQVMLRKPSKITGFVTRGRHGMRQFVRTYKVQYSDDGTKWKEVKDSHGAVKIFTGNNNAWGYSSSTLDAPIVALFIRVIPVTWYVSRAFRFEIRGCPIPNAGNQTCWKANRATGIPTFDMFSTTRTNLGECGKECHNEKECHAFTFNHGSGLCQGHSHSNYLNVIMHPVDSAATTGSSSLLFVKRETCP
ncbi:lactadherin-like [Pecten maximus]|uniref:lactadherin-like n=1 Tax=Pecten maximus TaxID=6579 RepID=UPI001458037A|nr:lactadherin-like [Pecten maximus]